jgi:serine/threonine protein kinase
MEDCGSAVTSDSKDEERHAMPHKAPASGQSCAERKMVGQYELGTLLGQGAFCKVRLASKAGTDEMYAVKIVNKASIRDIRDLERVMREMHVLRNISHPNIISMHESIEKGSRLYLILDYATAGELHDYCIAKGPLSEKLARVFFTHILTGVDFMHRQGISLYLPLYLLLYLLYFF